MSWINNGIAVCASAACGAYMILGLFVFFGRLQDKLLARLERRRWVTTFWNECPTCKRCEVTRTAMYDADLGWDHVGTFDLCWSCRVHANQPMEIDLDTMTAEQIRSLVPEIHESPRQVSATVGRSRSNRFGATGTHG